MSLEELWQLFPIILTPHKDIWKDWFIEEKNTISQLLSSPDFSTIIISHIGSTAIPGIWAKPTVDLLIEFPNVIFMNDACDILCKNNYGCMAKTDLRIDLNKGYTKLGFEEKVFHIHLRCFGDNDELYFRDYLINNPDTAKSYEDLKLRLWKINEHNRDAYTDGKHEFVTSITNRAKKRYHYI